MLEIRRKTIEPEIMVLQLVGRVTMGKPCEDLETAVDELVEKKVRKVIIDLSETARVDSTGLSTIVTCFRKLKDGGGELRLAGARGVVGQIARAANIQRIVGFYGTVEEAAAGFAGPAGEVE
jgi:anti-sigma B factor antagonist